MHCIMTSEACPMCVRLENFNKELETYLSVFDNVLRVSRHVRAQDGYWIHEAGRCVPSS